jgi:hypothetical protein
VVNSPTSFEIDSQPPTAVDSLSSVADAIKVRKEVLLSHGLSLLDVGNDPSILEMAARIRLLQTPTNVGSSSFTAMTDPHDQVTHESSVNDDSLTPEVTNVGISPPFSLELPLPFSLATWVPKLSATWTPFEPMSVSEQALHDNSLNANSSTVE